MALRRELVEFMASQVTDDLVKRGFIELPENSSVNETIFEVLNDEIALEDRINDEVRTLLNEYGNQMRESGASYQEMFKLIKKKLVRERKIVL